MPKKLLLGENFLPRFETYDDAPLGEGFARVRPLYGAPKHGTEMTVITQRVYDGIYYDGGEKIFKEKAAKESSVGFGLGNMFVGEITEIRGGACGFEIGERVAGYGILSETQTVKTSELLKMPGRMTWKEAVCYDPLQFALSGARDAGCRLGDAVLISGLGAIGQMAAQAARLSGASIVAVSDPISRRREAAKENGADFAFDPETEDVGSILRGITGGRGADVVIECSGYYEGIQSSVRALAYNGSMALVGWYQTCAFPLNLGLEGHMNQQNIFFSRACSEPNREYPRWDFARICAESWRLLCEGRIKCENLIFPIIGFGECDGGYEKYVMNEPCESIKLGVEY